MGFLSNLFAERKQAQIRKNEDIALDTALDYLRLKIDSTPVQIKYFLDNPLYSIGNDLSVAKYMAEETRQYLLNGGMFSEYKPHQLYDAADSLARASDRASVILNEAKLMRVDSKITDMIDMLEYAQEKGIFNFQLFQTPPDDYEGLINDWGGFRTLEDMELRGGKACFAGLISLWPAFDSIPMIRHCVYPRAYIDEYLLTSGETLALMLGIPAWFADAMIYTGHIHSPYDGRRLHILYGKPIEDVQAADVIEVLQLLKSGLSADVIMEMRNVPKRQTL